MGSVPIAQGVFRAGCRPSASSKLMTSCILALFEDIFVREFWWIILLRTIHNWRESSKVTSPRGIFSPAIRAQESLYKFLLKTDQLDYRKLMIFCLFYFLCCQPVYIAVRIWFDRQFRGVLVLLKLYWAPDIVEFVLGRFSHFNIAITYSNSTFCGAWTPSFCEFTQIFSKTSTPSGIRRKEILNYAISWKVQYLKHLIFTKFPNEFAGS